MVHTAFGGGILLRWVFYGAEEDGDGEEDILMDYNLCDRRKERTDTGVIEEDVLREVHILVDTTPFACSRMVFHKTINDVVLTCRPLDDGGTSDERENPRRAGEQRS